MRSARPDLANFHGKVLMDDMMEAVGVSLLDGGRSYVRARGNCHGCSCQAECRDWFGGRGENERADFCPNTDLFHRAKDVGADHGGQKLTAPHGRRIRRLRSPALRRA